MSLLALNLFRARAQAAREATKEHLEAMIEAYAVSGFCGRDNWQMLDRLLEEVAATHNSLARAERVAAENPWEDVTP